MVVMVHDHRRPARAGVTVTDMNEHRVVGVEFDLQARDAGTQAPVEFLALGWQLH